ncbi:hypothetical protein PIROE2DRAFT_64391 [Piromyces sp. E2]|nr:hypothetical protein PIROE2DRAFT_64391 [Piromyces sp. E2]|eukprot:OUM58474.1 hypothetical protein PIROE2DRAFT_64391 [Piromyces sp. E2]
MKFNYKVIPILFALFSYCQGQILTNNNKNYTIENTGTDVISSSLKEYYDIDEDRAFNIDININRNVNINKTKRAKKLPSLTSITCGDNTKTCNIGFGEIKVKMYNTIWYISTPVATSEETFRKKFLDIDENISMIATIHSYNAYFDVHIHGYLYTGGCINDRNNKCTLDIFETPSPPNADISLNNIEDKSYKIIRFKYSDWLGKCYKKWKVYFDIQGTKKDLKDWYYLNKINLDDFY